MSMQDPNATMDSLISEIKNCIDKATSFKKCNTDATKLKARKNWSTKGIMISCKTEENLYSLWNKNRSIKQLETEYKQYAKMLEKVIKVAKSRHESDLIRKNSKNPRNLWKYINTKLGTKPLLTALAECFLKEN